jgi:hypothetical protein
VAMRKSTSSTRRILGSWSWAEKDTYQEAATRWSTSLYSYRSDAMALAGPRGKKQVLGLFSPVMTIGVIGAPTHMLPSSVNHLLPSNRMDCAGLGFVKARL